MPTPNEGGPISLVGPSGVSYINALLSGVKWGGGVGSGVSLSYSFPSSGSVWSTADPFLGGYGPPGGNGEPWWSDYAGLNAGQQAAFMQALAAWQEVANITFTQVADTSTEVGEIRVAFSGAVPAQGFLAWAYYPWNTPVGGDVWLDPHDPANTAPEVGNLGYLIYLHELGHSLGLKHPFEDGVVLPAAQDTTQYTVMSYTSYVGATVEAMTPMLYDIAAIQYLYGANMTTRTGDDVYQVSAASEELRTIWDAGGVDTLSAANQTVAVSINLNAGTFSSIGVKNDGGTAKNNIAIAFGVTIENAVGGSGNDTLIGNAATNKLTGAAGNDSLSGGNGNDTLDGQSGKDTLVGGADNDTYFVNAVGEVVTESLTGTVGGTDTVMSEINYTLGANLENLVLIGALMGTGNTLNNALTGNDLGNTLNGLAGADTMTGGAGDDIYVFDNKNDVATENLGEGIDEIRSSVALSTFIANVENYTFTGTTAVNFTGSDADNKITGTAYNDTLVGDGGNDTLTGGAGADSLDGGAGSDSYFIDNVGDKISDSGGLLDTVQSTITFILASGLENLTLTGTGAINGTGNAGDNIITGDPAANKLDGMEGNDTLVGGAGNDTLTGGPGSDSLAGGDGSDTYFVGAGDTVMETNGLAAGGVDVVFSDVDFTLGANIEKLTLTGTADIDGTGNALADTITGNAGSNLLDGQGGKDTMVGGAGDDTYVVDVVGEVVTESLTGTAGGTDTVKSAVNYTLGANLENLVLIGAALTGTGNTLNNQLTGNGEANKLQGLAGNDTLTGNAGNDTLDGGIGNDSLIGGDGDDLYIQDNALDVIEETGSSDTGDELRTNQSTLTGVLPGIEHYTFTGTTAVNFTGNSADNKITGTAVGDTLIGNAGNDTLNGGAGADSLIGGIGNDSYVIDNVGDKIADSDGTLDTVQSSVTFILASGLENLTLTGSGAINGTGNVGNNIITGNLAANKLDGKEGDDSLIGAAGNDTLTGGEGNDTLDGGSGSDSMVGGAGNDTYKVSVGTDLVSETLTGLAGGTDTVQSEVSYTLGANLENLVLIGAALTGAGNALANQLTGNDLNNTLNGGVGADTMLGGGGNDIYVVDNALDKVDETSGNGTDTVKSSISFDLSAATVLGDVENLTLTGTATINGTGNDLANIITGNSAVNTLTGGAGNDALNGGLGADNLVGGLGSDTYVVDNALDKVDETGGDGTDTVKSSVSFNLSAAPVLGAVENLTLTGTATINGTGNDLANIITGNAAVNLLSGGGGNDTLDGAAGNDTVTGGTGDDQINVGSGNDTVKYTSTLDGHDVINGFDGNSLGGQDVLNLDALFDSLGIAAANRATSIDISDLGATVEVRVNTGGAPDFDLFVATLNTTDTITVGQDIIVGS